MQHCTPEQLALAALRETLPANEDAHLASCGSCRAEVTALRRAPELLAVPHLAAPVDDVPPPPQVWQAIAAATGVTATPADHSPVRAAPATPAADPGAPWCRSAPAGDRSC